MCTIYCGTHAVHVHGWTSLPPIHSIIEDQAVNLPSQPLYTTLNFTALYLIIDLRKFLISGPWRRLHRLSWRFSRAQIIEWPGRRVRADYQTSAIIQTEISGRHKRGFEGEKKRKKESRKCQKNSLYVGGAHVVQSLVSNIFFSSTAIFVLEEFEHKITLHLIGFWRDFWTVTIVWSFASVLLYNRYEGKLMQWEPSVKFHR